MPRFPVEEEKAFHFDLQFKSQIVMSNPWIQLVFGSFNLWRPETYKSTNSTARQIVVEVDKAKKHQRKLHVMWYNGIFSRSELDEVITESKIESETSKRRIIDNCIIQLTMAQSSPRPYGSPSNKMQFISWMKEEQFKQAKEFRRLFQYGYLDSCEMDELLIAGKEWFERLKRHEINQGLSVESYDVSDSDRCMVAGFGVNKNDEVPVKKKELYDLWVNDTINTSELNELTTAMDIESKKSRRIVIEDFHFKSRREEILPRPPGFPIDNVQYLSKIKEVKDKELSALNHLFRNGFLDSAEKAELISIVKEKFERLKRQTMNVLSKCDISNSTEGSTAPSYAYAEATYA